LIEYASETSVTRVSTNTKDGAASDAASALEQVADVREREVLQPTHCRRGAEVLVLDPGLQSEVRNAWRNSQMNISDTSFWADLYSKFLQPGMLPPTVARKTPEVMARTNATNKSAHFSEGHSGIAPPWNHSAEVIAEVLFNLGIAHPCHDNAEAPLQSRPHGNVHSGMPQPGHHHAPVLLQTGADENAHVLLATRSLISETRVLITGGEANPSVREVLAETRANPSVGELNAESRANPSVGELIAETRALITEAEAISGARNARAAPQTEVTAKCGGSMECSRREADVTDPRAIPTISSGSKELVDAAERSSHASLMVVPSGSNSTRSTARVRFDLPSELPRTSWTSWTSKPSVATWLNATQRGHIIPKRRPWACKPSAATWLQEAPECTTSTS